MSAPLGLLGTKVQLDEHRADTTAENCACGRNKKVTGYQQQHKLFSPENLAACMHSQRGLEIFITPVSPQREHFSKIRIL